MKVVVTGGAGYLGTSLVPMLLEGGHEVTVIDRFFFGDDVFGELAHHPALHLTRDDVRWLDGRTLVGQDAVIDMAALSNDPSGELDPWKTFEINYLGRARVARLAREAKVPRYILTSSCSVYGFRDGLLDESTPPNPLTTYARANIESERDILPLSGPHFTATAVRMATLYGLSGRMRFDIAINGMVLGGWSTKKIPIMKDGTQWRPFLHVRDAARAILGLLSQDPEVIRGRAFNVGSDEQNFQILPLAQEIAGVLQHHPDLEWYGDPDHRSYRVSFRQAREELGFRPQHTPADAAREIEHALESKTLVPSMRHKTVEWYRHLLHDPAAAAEVRLHDVVL